MIEFIIPAILVILVLISVCVYLAVELKAKEVKIDGYEDSEHDAFSDITIKIPKRVYANERLTVNPDGATLIRVPKDVERPSRIPRTIVQSYSSNIIPYRMAKAVENMLKVNEEYDYSFYDDEDAVQFLKKHCTPRVLEAFHAVRPGAYKCDIFRLAYLLVHGGWYADIYFDAIKPLDTLPPKDLYVVHDGPDPNSLSVFQALIGCVPGNPVIGYILDRIVDRVLSYYEPESVLSLTGPIAFGTFLRDFYHPGQMTLREGEFPHYTMMLHDNERIVSYKGQPYFRTKYPGWCKDRKGDLHYGVLFSKGNIYTNKDPRNYVTNRDGPADLIYMKRVLKPSAEFSESISEKTQNKLAQK